MFFLLANFSLTCSPFAIKHHSGFSWLTCLKANMKATKWAQYCSIDSYYTGEREFTSIATRQPGSGERIETLESYYLSPSYISLELKYLSLNIYGHNNEFHKHRLTIGCLIDIPWCCVCNLVSEMVEILTKENALDFDSEERQLFCLISCGGEILIQCSGFCISWRFGGGLHGKGEHKKLWPRCGSWLEHSLI